MAEAKARNSLHPHTLPHSHGRVVVALQLMEIVEARQQRVLPLPDPGVVGELMGKAGATIRALQEETGCSVDVDKDASTWVIRVVLLFVSFDNIICRVTLTGTTAALEAAASRITVRHNDMAFR
jgi:hypothetical protein